VLSGLLEHPGQAGGPETLEVVGTGARLVDPGARGDHAVPRERGEGVLEILLGVDGADARESWEMRTPLYSKPTASSSPPWRPIARNFSVTRTTFSTNSNSSNGVAGITPVEPSR
jgi:hypothetical protein